MTDIVTRLRARTFRPGLQFEQAFNEQGNLTLGDAALHEEAAMTIEHLRLALGVVREDLTKLRDELEPL